MEDYVNIFNLDDQDFVKQEAKKEEDPNLYRPYPEFGKDGVYKSIIRFVPNIYNVKKSKIHYYYVWLKDPNTNSYLKVFCPTTVGKKSILNNIYWKLKKSISAREQELSKLFKRKEDFYSLVQIVKDPNKPELEGKIMYFKFGKKINDLIEQQIKPGIENITPSNPYDLFEGKNFSLHVRKVGEWNNYDLCSFVGEKTPIIINGKPAEKTEEGKRKIIEYLKSGPSDLTKFEYRDWTPEEEEKIINIIKETIPDLKILSDIININANSPSDNNNLLNSNNVNNNEIKNDYEKNININDFIIEESNISSNDSLDDFLSDL